MKKTEIYAKSGMRNRILNRVNLYTGADHTRQNLRIMTFFQCFILFIFGPSMPLVSQPGPMLPGSAEGRLFLRHTVAPKENWYSVGRTYHIGPRDIASFNDTEIEKSLSIGQKLRIPLTEANFNQTGKAENDEALVPLYHVVQGKEGLFRIGQEYNKISVDQLKALNGLQSDAIRPGMKLIVGYLRVAKGQKEWTAQVVNPSNIIVQSATEPLAGERQEPQKEVKTSAALPEGSVLSEPKPAPKQDIQAPRKTAVATTVRKSERLQLDSSITPGGYFAALFAEQSRSGSRMEKLGFVASFKSTSGWKDGKFYILTNGILPGTIVRLTNPVNGRQVYVKVLGELPPIRENENLTGRISNASMSALELEEGAYELRFEWAK